jgi:hypothetical protein
MKQPKLKSFILMPLAVAVMANVNISFVGAQVSDTNKTTGDTNKTTGDTNKTTGDANKTTGDANKTTGDANKTAGDANKTAGGSKLSSSPDNTISFVALGLSILNSIGLGLLFWLNQKAVNKVREKVRSSEQRIEALKSKDQSLDTHIKKVDGDQQNSSHKTNKEIELIKRSIEEISRRSASIQQSAPIPQSNHRTERYISPSERYTPEPPNRQLSHTDYYNDRQSDFQNKYQITPVSREAENLNQSLAAQTDSVVLAGDRQGNYWLFSDNSEIYLVPKQNLKITDNRISNTKDLFECRDYTEQNYDNFVLIKPAVLIAQGNGNWQLKEKGKLQFG